MTCNRPVLLIGSQMRMGGAQKALLSLAGWIHGEGVPVYAVFFYDKDGLQAQWQAVAEFPIISLDGWNAQQSWLNPFRLLRGLFRLYRLMRCQHFQSMITYTEHANVLALPVAWLAGIPRRIASTRGRILGFKIWQGRLHAWMINLGLAMCLVANSESGRTMSILSGVHPKNIIVIPNGVEVLQADAQVRRRIRQELGIDEQAQMVLSAGRLTYEKGHDLLISAALLVLGHHPQAFFALAGNGILRSQHEAQVKQLGIGDRVHFLGFRPDIHDLMCAADIFVLPSRTEGMPNAMLEAMGMGLPVAAFNVGGVGEVVSHNLTGLLAAPEDPGDLARSLIHLMDDIDFRQQIAQAAQEHVRQHFSQEKMFHLYTDLLVDNEFEPA